MGFFSSNNSFFTSLEMHENIMIVSSNNSLIYINKAGLKFFGFNSIKAFKTTHKYTINELFIEEKGYADKYTFGKNWLSKIAEQKQRNRKIKVKLYSHIDNMEQYFYIHVTALKKNEFLLSFCNIHDIELEKNNLQKQADFDPLTQIYNRVKFNEVFPLAITRADQYGEGFSLILFDIDHFKSINDTLGHPIGDKVLFELARSVNMKINEKDIFARWGGEEFIILAKHLTAKEAYKLAESLRKYIQGHNFGNGLTVTCSFGVTEFQPKDNKVSIFQRVDEALYLAKKEGRNRVVIQ
jgi:diguanylate cyclase (GGDEF)-like protein